MKHANFQLSRIYPTGVIWKNRQSMRCAIWYHLYNLKNVKNRATHHIGLSNLAVLMFNKFTFNYDYLLQKLQLNFFVIKPILPNFNLQDFNKNVSV